MTDKSVTIEGAIELHLHLAPNHSLVRFGDRMIIDPKPEMAPVAKALQDAGAELYSAFANMPRARMSDGQQEAMNAYAAASNAYVAFHDKLKTEFAKTDEGRKDDF